MMSTLTNLEYTLDFATKCNRPANILRKFDSSKKTRFSPGCFYYCYVWCTHCENRDFAGYQRVVLVITYQNSQIIINNASILTLFKNSFVGRKLIKNLKIRKCFSWWKNSAWLIFSVKLESNKKSRVFTVVVVYSNKFNNRASGKIFLKAEHTKNLQNFVLL